MNTIRSLLVVTFVFAVSSIVTASVHAGFEGYWLQTSVSESDVPMAGKRSETEEQKILYRSGMMKTIDLDTGRMTILRMDKGLMWEVDPEDSTYTEITFAEMEEMAAEGKERMAKAKAEMEAQMEDMSPEEQKLMEKLMGGKMAALMGAEEGSVELSVRRTGEKEKIGGYTCERTIVTANDDPFVEMWVTDEFDLGGQLFAFYEKMNLFKHEPTEELEQFKGFPMKTVFTMDMGMGTVKNVSTVTKVVETSLKNSDFDLPKGLRKEKSRMVQPE